MSLQALMGAQRLRRHETSVREIADLLALAERGVTDAAVDAISLDLRFASAYDAALSLATIPLACAGYRTRGAGHHSTTFEALPAAMGPQVRNMAGYLNLCRTKRNQLEYRRVGVVSETEVVELCEAVVELRAAVLEWLQETLPDLLPDPS